MKLGKVRRQRDVFLNIRVFLRNSKGDKKRLKEIVVLYCMVNYENGKIYKILDRTTGKCYVGSTAEIKLSHRLGKHVHNYKEWKSGKRKWKVSCFEILEGGNYEVVLIENFPCSSKEELHARERHWIESLDCVNIMIPTRTQKEYVEANKDKIIEWRKQHYQDNKEFIKAKSKAYYENNFMKVQAIKNAYREKNREKLKNDAKTYYNTKRETILSKQREKVVCECGAEVSKNNLLRHKTTSKAHQSFMKLFDK